MQSRVTVGPQDIPRLQHESLFHLHQLFKAGIVRVTPLPSPALLLSPIHAYLHLQDTHAFKAEVVCLIDQLVTNGESLLDTTHAHTEDTPKILPPQIVETILRVFPQAIQRYRIGEAPHKAQGRVVVSWRNGFAVANIQNICIRFLSGQVNLQQSIGIIRQVLLPIYFGRCTTVDSKLCLQAIKQTMTAHRGRNIQEQLSSLFLSNYQNYWQANAFTGNAEQVGVLERQFTLLEVINHQLPYPLQLVRLPCFRSHLKALLQFSGENRGSVHLLGIRVYERSAVCVGEAGTMSQVFVKVFNILSCYGSHLVKDVWGSFYGLVQTNGSALFQKLELIDIVLGKLQRHENSNVIKNCLHELLKNEQSNRIFQLTPTVVYNSLIRMLNLGVHYLDCMFHMDSKMYSLIAAFFLRYYNSQLSQACLQQHLSWLLDAVLAKTNYDHALIALIGVFPQQQSPTSFLGKEQLDSTLPLLSAAYSRFPIRKRFQLVDGLLGLIANNINRQQVSVPHLMRYLSHIQEEYLIQSNLGKLRDILGTYPLKEREAWSSQQVTNILEGIRERIRSEVADLGDTYDKMRMLQLYQRLYEVHFVEYEYFLLDLVKEFGESQYKNIQQRQAFIKVYSLVHQTLIAQLRTTVMFVPHLDAVLNLIAHYAQLHTSGSREEALLVVGKLCRRAYGWMAQEEFKEREGERVVLARMMEWASDRLGEVPIALDIILQVCRARIAILFERKKASGLYSNYQHLFEESLYDLFEQLSRLQLDPNHPCRCASLKRDKQLRLRVLLTTILLHDHSHPISQTPPSCDVIGEVIDCYDFQNYEEVCWMVQTIYSPNTAAFSLNKQMVSDEEANELTKQLELLLENMVHNLEYSLGKKEIVAITECTIEAMLAFAYATGVFSQSLVDFAVKLIKAGESYLIFQRAVALRLAQELAENFNALSRLDCKHLLPLILGVLTIEEYRGFDSAVYLAHQNSELPIYLSFKVQLESNYEGAIPRFLTIFAFKQVLGQAIDQRGMLFMRDCIWAAMQVCMGMVAKEKMFLSGRNKLKLQLWQFLLVFPAHLLPAILGKQQFQRLLLRCVEAIGHNLISEIRYYSQMFLMRALTCTANYSLIPKEVLRGLRGGLEASIGNVNRTIAYIVVSGILIKHISQQGEGILGDELVGLYNCLLTYVGSSVAYFRGLTQFFCLGLTSGCLETRYVQILRENFLMDKDAEQLIGRLGSIMGGYMGEMADWEIEREVLRKTPNNNRNVVAEGYYMDALRQFSTELAKINKNLDGFTAYRYIWRKNVARGEAEQQEEEPTLEQQEEAPEAEQEEDIFQRKIDPTLDHLYGCDSQSHLKILVTSGKSYALMGHLARTGEIFGIEELIVPSKKVMELDQFKSISVTAERWLNITDLGAEEGGRPTASSLLALIVRLKAVGYTVVRLSKSQSTQQKSGQLIVPTKCLLIVDQEEMIGPECLRLIDWELEVGRHLSQHVEASIFIWSYFKANAGGQHKN